MSRLMLCLIQNDNSLTTKGNHYQKKAAEHGSSRAVCNLSQIPGTCKGTTHLEYGKFREVLKSRSECALFPRTLPSWVSLHLVRIYQSTPTLKKKKHKKTLAEQILSNMTQLLCFQNVATKLVNPKQIGRETIEFSWPDFSLWPFFSFLT